MLAKWTPVNFYHDGEKVPGNVDHYDDVRDVYAVRLKNGTLASVSSEFVQEDDDEPEHFQRFDVGHHESSDYDFQGTFKEESSPSERSLKIRRILTGIGVAVTAVFLAFAVTRHKPEPSPEKPKAEALVIIERMNERNLKMAKPSEVPLVESCSALKTLEKENAKDWESLQKIRNR